ncbi:MAG: Sua5/YciO/YrdC/YwlC family protein [Sulfurospirillaceae bacterium]|nr:Sua5/YciO/YrdC/YwlC family protein [Sulfurospirillaceae bacterium]
MNPTKVYLVQTETTVGFLSQSADALASTKNRPQTKPFLISVDSIETLKKFARIPKNFSKAVRRAEKTTYVFPCNLAVRVVKQRSHLDFLKKLTWSYSTSANASGKNFNEAFAREKADIIVETCSGFFEDCPSAIYKIGRQKIRKLR